MRPFNKPTAVAAANQPPSKTSLIASAIEISYADLVSWRTYRLGRDEVWQRELWRLYDIVGELRFAANWVGSMMSRVRIYIAEVDETGAIGPETTDPDLLAVSNNLLGGPQAKAEALRLMGIDLTVCGEFYIVGYAGRANGEDSWYIVTPSELNRWASGVFYNSIDGPIQLLDNVDMLIRVWTPHPRRVWLADSPAHGAMNIIVELERLTKYVFSQIDSRLFGGGLLLIPDDMDFPDEDGTEGAADSLMAKLAKAGMASLRGEGSATGILPVIAEVPKDALGKIQLITFDTGLSAQALELRKEAIMRFAYSMDFPPEIMTGLGASNHWSAWYIDENAVKVHIEPPMGRVCDALTKAILIPACKKLGKDPKRFTFAFDTSGLTVRATRLEDALNLYKEGILGPEAVLEAGYFRKDQAMTDAEAADKFGKLAAIQDPQLMADKDFRKMIRVDSFFPDSSTVGTQPLTGPPPPPPNQTGALPSARQPIPDRQSAPATPVKRPASAVTASSAVALAIISGANLAVLRALELAGGRLLTRSQRFPETPKTEIHTMVTVQDSQTQALLAGAWTFVPAWADSIGGVDIQDMVEALDDYTTELLLHSKPHNPDSLLDDLRRRGLIDG